MSEKNIINYMQPNGTMISYRESMKAFAPKKDEFKKLRKKIIEIIGKKTTSEFDDTLDYLITFLRNKAFINESAPSITKMQKEVSDLKKELNKVQNLLESGLSDTTQMYITNAMIIKRDEIGPDDPMSATHSYATLALVVCETALKSIKGRKPSFTPNDMRQVLAEELARELDKMSVEPKKYKNGKYARVLRAILKMIPCTVHGKKISIATPENIFKVICKAIDEYPTKQPYPLLSIQ